MFIVLIFPTVFLEIINIKSPIVFVLKEITIQKSHKF